MHRFHSFLQEGAGEESASPQPKPQETKSQPISEKTDLAKKLPNTIEGSSAMNLAEQRDDSKRVEGLKKKKQMRKEKQSSDILFDLLI